MRRSDSSVRMSLILASRRCIGSRPSNSHISSPYLRLHGPFGSCPSNSHISSPYLRLHGPFESWLSYWNRIAIRSSSKTHRFFHSA